MTTRQTLIAGAFFSFLSVAIGAFAAHGLKLQGYEQMVFETGVRYQFYHSLALILVGTIAIQKPTWVPNSVPYLFLAGIIIFSGSLYILAITGMKWLGAITPIGGMCFLIGWLFLLTGLLKSKS
jgi:uncharacterized membrane protein YgdD (TMEM256/DUF423 family)